MLKQLVRGVIYFENKKKEDVEKVFNPFKLDEVKFKIFEKIKINNKEILNPGVYLNGKINEKYTSENVVRLFRKLMGLDIEKKNFNLSIEKEDELDELDVERNFNYYYSLEFKKTEVNAILLKIKDNIFNDLITRTRDVGYLQGVLMSSLEIFSKENIDEKINKIFLDEKINSEKNIRIEF